MGSYSSSWYLLYFCFIGHLPGEHAEIENTVDDTNDNTPSPQPQTQTASVVVTFHLLQFHKNYCV